MGINKGSKDIFTRRPCQQMCQSVDRRSFVAHFVVPFPVHKSFHLICLLHQPENKGDLRHKRGLFGTKTRSEGTRRSTRGFENATRDSITKCPMQRLYIHRSFTLHGRCPYHSDGLSIEKRLEILWI